MRRWFGGIFIGLTVILLAESPVERQRAWLDTVVLRELEVSEMPLEELLTEELPRLIRRDATKGETVQLVYLPARILSAKDELVTLHLTKISLAEVLQLLCWQYRLRIRVTPNAVVLTDAALGLSEEYLGVYPAQAGAWDTRRTRKRLPSMVSPHHNSQ